MISGLLGDGNSRIRKGYKAAAILSAAVCGFSAVQASASVVALSNGDSLNLNPANVIYAFYGSSVSTNTQVVQGVTFYPATNSNVSGPLTYSTGSGFPTGLLESDGGGENTLALTFPTENTSSPAYTDGDDQAMLNLANDGLFYSGNSTETLTVGGLNPGQPYLVNLLFDLGGYTARDLNPTLNTVSETTDDLSQATENENYIYATTDTVVANGSGQIVFSATQGTGSPPFINAMVISATPEPASIGVIGVAFSSLALRRRRAKAAKQP